MRPVLPPRYRPHQNRAFAATPLAAASLVFAAQFVEFPASPALVVRRRDD